MGMSVVDLQARFARRPDTPKQALSWFATSSLSTRNYKQGVQPIVSAKRLVRNTCSPLKMAHITALLASIVAMLVLAQGQVSAALPLTWSLLSMFPDTNSKVKGTQI